MRKGFVASAAILIFASPARSAEDDAQLWSGIVATGPLSGNLLIWLDAQARAGAEPSRFRQTVLRGGLGFAEGRHLTLFAGYAWFQGGRFGNLTTEHRLWQQLGFTIMDRPALRITGRARLEQRFIGDGMVVRVRQQVRIAIPLSQNANPVSAVITTEPFVHLNGDGTGERSGLDRWRAAAGLSIPVRGGLSLEPGYLGQYISRRSADSLDHVVALNVVARW